ncbi:hypothetical protein QA640_31005 [Bradyrhizobium sp. CB82]|uniref:hypothetical protein n=1 Tax=Bradyrhizobium sp. CB82 TaxID=3039159 RepID=UPI0024B06955|nr:hypothetical protein [Bradyrhizobium sp. CB82]WFU38811.1 hypothetical protein QA640_31005 [Bradyrhizobium sp. CB82]
MTDIRAVKSMFRTGKSQVAHQAISPDINHRKTVDRLRLWLPFIFGGVEYLALLRHGNKLLLDSDVYLHFAVGQWIIDHRAFPHADPFSFTMTGTNWITSAWLSELLFLAAFRLAGWAGPVTLAALAVGTAFFLLTRLLLRALPPIPVSILVGCAMVVTTSHLHARPHVLVLPVMVLWANAIVEAAEQRRAPSLAYLVLMCLWANLHGSFTLGLALIPPFAAEALWTADRSARARLAFQWFRFGVLALGAACITPYGPESILVTFRLFGLGHVLSAIGEWQPQDFGVFNPFEVSLLAGMAYILYSGFKLPPLRIVLLLAVIHQTLAHLRYIDVMAMVAPFFIARPLAQHLSGRLQQNDLSMTAPTRRWSIAFAVALLGLTSFVGRMVDFSPAPSPSAALETIKEAKSSRIFNDYPFGSYLIYRGIPPFIDSRAELYGAEFITRYRRAVGLQDVSDLLRVLDEYQITATLLTPTTPAVALFDRMEGWERVYADDIAVVHLYRGNRDPKISPGRDVRGQATSPPVTSEVR